MLSLTCARFWICCQTLRPLHGITLASVSAVTIPVARRRADLSSCKLRFSLHARGGNAFIDVVRKFKRRTECVGKLARRARTCRFPQLHNALGSSCCQRPVAGNDFGKRMHFRMNVVPRNHTFDQAVSFHFSGVDFTTRAEQFERSSGTYDIWKPDWRACAWKSDPFCLRRREVDMIAGDPYVAGKSEFDSTGANITIQAGDDDLRQGFDRIEGLVGQPGLNSGPDPWQVVPATPASECLWKSI